jgi:hypothetical protein
MLKQCETKHKTVSFENNALYHNSLSIPLNHLIDLTNGDGDDQRVGDEVIGKYIKFKLWFASKFDRPNVKIRVMVLRVPINEHTGVISPFNNDHGNKLLDYINTEKYTPVYQKFININTNTAIGPDSGLPPPSTGYDWNLKERSVMHSFTIPLKDEKIKFLEGENRPKFQKFNLRFVAVAYDAYGTATTDNIASYAGNYRFYYKDP